MTVASRLSSVLGHLGGGATSDTFSKHPNDAVIVLVKRSPLCKFAKGGYKDMRGDELTTAMLKATIPHLPVKPAEVQDICVGTVQGKDQAASARASSIAAGFRSSTALAQVDAEFLIKANTTAVEVVNRMCSSGLMAISIIANQIRNKEIDCGLAVGMENLSANGWGVSDSLSDEIMAHPEAQDCIMPMGWTSENVAGDFNITRQEMDEFAFRSHSRAAEAQAKGLFVEEIIPIEALRHTPESAKTKDSKQRQKVLITEDDGLRATTLEGLSKAKSAFPQWAPAQTTGGNASQLTDGAAVCLLMSRAKADALGLKIIAKHVATSIAGLEPRIMGIGPTLAIPKVLQRTGLQIEDVDIFEINEAFSSMYVYCVKKLGLDPEKVNPMGGAIALGHPYGCTGVRQVATGMAELKRRNGRILCTSMCIGLGMGAAAIFVRE